MKSRTAPRPSSPASSTRPSKSTRTPTPPPAALEPPAHVGGITYQRKWILCGRQACGRWHGPYWYAFWSDHGRTRCKYVGKNLPDGIRPAKTDGTGTDSGDR